MNREDTIRDKVINRDRAAELFYITPGSYRAAMDVITAAREALAFEQGFHDDALCFGRLAASLARWDDEGQ